MRMKYLWLFIIVLKSFLVYVTDIFTAITMLTTTSWSNQIFENCSKDKTGCISIPYNTGKWLFVGCIIFSFLLVSPSPYVKTRLPRLMISLSWVTNRARPRKSSRVETYLTLSLMSWRTTTIPFVSQLLALDISRLKAPPAGSYDHFCFFDHISSSTKTSDDFAFFVFFVFKSKLPSTFAFACSFSRCIKAGRGSCWRMVLDKQSTLSRSMPSGSRNTTMGSGTTSASTSPGTLSRLPL